MPRLALLVVVARVFVAGVGWADGTEGAPVLSDVYTDEDPRPPKPASVPATLPPSNILHGLQNAMDDPQVVDDALRAAARPGAEMPAPAVLIIADALVRRGDLRRARRLYALVAKAPGDQGVWADAARLGLGWVAISRGHVDEARRYLGGQAGPTAGLSRVLTALLDAAQSRPGAPEALAELARDASLSPQLREAARLGTGYAYFWARDYAQAEVAFRRVVRPPLADDAAYAAAWTSHVAGDDAAARPALTALAGDADPSTGPVSRRLVRLEPPAVLRAGLGRNPALHVATDDTWVADMLDGDGRQLARAALRLLGWDATADGRASGSEPHAASAPERALRTSAGETHGDAGGGPDEPAAAEGDRSHLVIVAIASVILTLFLLRWRRSLVHQPGR
jgi:hypothetical protein